MDLGVFATLLQSIARPPAPLLEMTAALVSRLVFDHMHKGRMPVSIYSFEPEALRAMYEGLIAGYSRVDRSQYFLPF